MNTTDTIAPDIEGKDMRQRKQHVPSPDGQRRHDQLPTFKADLWLGRESEDTAHGEDAQGVRRLGLRVKEWVFIVMAKSH